MKTLHKLNKCIYYTIIVCSLTITAYSQSIQKESMRAPSDIKIDGKTLEWPGNKLNAYNTVDNIWYSVTNDDNNIYLTVRGPYYPNASKVFAGGLTFTISKSIDSKERKKAIDNIAVTFPVVSAEKAQDILLSVAYYSVIRRDTLGRKKDHDSLVNVVNLKTTNALKEIKVTGIKEITDTLISIYNNTDIKAMGSFNRGMAFTVEMAIPLKYLGLSVKDASKFSYNIMLNAEPVLIMASQTGLPMISRISPGLASSQGDVGYMLNPTDFWSEYTLIGAVAK